MDRTIALISLGCAKNLVNSEQMLYLLSEAGYALAPSPEGADAVIINTCGFIDAAKSEAIDTILEMAKLKADGCIIVDADGRIALTEKGRQIAEKIYERHIVLSKALMALGVDEETALSDACKMEHDLSDRSFEAIKKHFKCE